jgi:acyl carrier protein
MDKNQIHNKIIEILSKNKITKKPAEEINLTDHFINDLDVDSIGMVTAMTALEKEFAIEIPQEDFILENFATLELTIDYIHKVLAASK